jgi:glyoxylase-like metal-dependent hydrolase (beta-lactamase superfamily II)
MTRGITLGAVTIHQVVEQEAPFFDFREFFPSLTDEMFDRHRHWLAPTYFDLPTGKIVLRIQSYILQTPHHNVLIDPCVGNLKPRPARPFWNMLDSDRYEKNLAATGLGVRDIDFVLCTHLHPDHVGWNTRLENGRWVPTFPRARYIMADRELAHWNGRHQQNPEACPWVTDSVLPIIDAGRAAIVKSDHLLDDLIRLVPTPGHTIDHYSVEVGRATDKAIFTGDMIHSPLQAYYPDLGMFADFDSAQAGRTRRDLLGRYCDTSALFCTAHFPGSSVGRFTSTADSFRFVPVETK